MALSGGELAAVISGSVAGLIFLLAVIAIVLYFCVRKRRRRRHPDKKPFPHHHLTPDTSLSKNSLPKQGDLRDPRAPPRLDPRLDPRVDPRLPKIGSTNLWFGTPSMYSAAPSQVYADMKRKGPTRPPEQPRAFPGPPGHVMYQGVGAGRIYHSQQVAPSLYDSEYRIQRSGSYMDLYSYPYNYDPYRDMNNSSAVLVEYPDKEEYYLDRYREREVRRTGKKVKRSQSDVTLHSTRRPKNRKQRGENAI
ncbi:hypothetical protein DPMN_027020 [Dreissena polymorpha]|uniref:Uncharacterized protein n=1 Tax=Dreissena polymorpha TaxID=45954 RepID=A0A9D4LUG1_DREPO|nr:hypothetical protein DPMN_027020 [Dreissena polymorpha]